MDLDFDNKEFGICLNHTVRGLGVIPWPQEFCAVLQLTQQAHRQRQEE